MKYLEQLKEDINTFLKVGADTAADGHYYTPEDLARDRATLAHFFEQTKNHHQN